MSNGYFSIPRSLTTDPLWKGLPPNYKEVFLVILENICFRPQKHDDHGHVVDLIPGQICFSYETLQAMCSKYISLNDVERCVKKLILFNFASKEVRYRKTILTITHRETYELILRGSEVKSEVNLRQTGGEPEVQTNNVRTEEPKHNTSSTYVTLEDKENFELELFKKNEAAMQNEDVAAFVYYCKLLEKEVAAFEFAKWLKFWDKDRIERNLVYSINKKTKDLTAYVQKAIMEDYASTEKEKKNETTRSLVSGKVHSIG